MRIFAFLLCFILLGCSGTTLTEKTATGAKETLSALVESLPPECRTDTVKTLKSAADTQIETVVSSCDNEKRVLEGKIRYRNLLICCLLGVIGVLIYLKVIKI